MAANLPSIISPFKGYTYDNINNIFIPDKLVYRNDAKYWNKYICTTIYTPTRQLQDILCHISTDFYTLAYSKINLLKLRVITVND